MSFRICIIIKQTRTLISVTIINVCAKTYILPDCYLTSYNTHFIFSVISFTPESSDVAAIDNSKHITCTAEGSLGTAGLTLTKSSGGEGGFSCSVSGNSTVVCGTSGYNITGTLITGATMTAELTIPEVVCSDTGTYECVALSDNTAKALLNLNVSRKCN